MIGQFGGDWHPLVARVRVDRHRNRSAPHDRNARRQGNRRTPRGDRQREAVLIATRNIAGIPASHYTGMLEVKPKGSGSVAEWRVQFLANGQPDIVVKTIVSTLLKTGLESLKTRFGVPP